MAQMKGGGTIVVLEIEGDKESTFAFVDGLSLFDISNNLGDTKSLVTHPATTTHSRLDAEQRALVGIGDNMVRLSIGLEDPADLLEDLTNALGRL